MLTITVPARELFDEKKEEFVELKEQKLQLEHSLVSVSKWEAKWKKVFLSDKDPKTEEEARDYIRCMTITQNVDPKVYNFLTEQNIKDIKEYIDDPMTATKIYKNGSKKEKTETYGTKKSKPYSSEEMYYWMIELGIPFECQKWHLNRLLMLIRVCSINGNQGNRMSKKDAAMMQAMQNSSRRARK